MLAQKNPNQKVNLILINKLMKCLHFQWTFDKIKHILDIGELKCSLEPMLKKMIYEIDCRNFPNFGKIIPISIGPRASSHNAENFSADGAILYSSLAFAKRLFRSMAVPLFKNRRRPCYIGNCF